VTSQEIREYTDQHMERRALDNEYATFRMLGEIAAQLAELNSKTANSADSEMLKKIEALSMKTCNSEKDLAVVVESIRQVFYDKKKKERA
jgi:hypothetical protein